MAAQKQNKKQRQSDYIWSLMEGLNINLFAMNQRLMNHVERVDLDNNVVHLKLRSSAVLPAMEEALSEVKLPEGKMFDITPVERYTIVSIVDKI